MSGFYKGISGVSLFLSIRLLIDYLGNEDYGIWVLLFTLFQLVLLMDFGIQSSLKTKIPLYFHENRKEKVVELIVSTYRVSVWIALFIFFLFLIVSQITNLKTNFNITGLDSREINVLFLTNIFFFCLTFIANIHKSLYVAFLKGKFSEQSIAVNQLVFLIFFIVFIAVSKSPYSSFEKLIIISTINGGVSVLVNLFYTLRFFHDEQLKINFLKKVDASTLIELFALGVKFMVLQIGFLFIFSSDSYIISNVFNPSEIVAYEVVNKLYLFPYMILFAALSPLWSMFAKHYLERNKSKLLFDFKKFNWYFLVILCGLIVLYFSTPFILSIWLKDMVKIPKHMVLLTAIITALKIYVSFYTFFLNGIGRLNFYVFILLAGAIVKIPLSYYFVNLNFGINSVLLSSLVIVSFWTFLIPMKSYRYINTINT